MSDGALTPAVSQLMTDGMRRVRWSLAITAVAVELGLLVAWRLWVRRRPRRPAIGVTP